MTSHHLVSPDPQNRPNAGIRRLAYVLTAWLAALVMAAAMVTGQKLALALALVVVFGALSWGWPGLIGLPNRGVGRAGVAVIGCAALACAVFGTVTHVAYVAALGVPVVYIGEMLRGDGRSRLLTQVAGTYAGGLLGIGGALWILVAELPGGYDLALSWVAGMALAAVACTFVRGPLIAAAVPVMAGLGSGALLVGTTDLPWWPAVAFAGILGVLAWGLEQMTPAVLTTEGVASRISFALIPFSAMGVVGYALSLLVL